MLTARADSVGVEGVPDGSAASEKFFDEGRERAIPAAGSVRLPLAARTSDALWSGLFVVESYDGFFYFFWCECALKQPNGDGGGNEF